MTHPGGRPPIPEEDRRKPLLVRLSPAERAELEAYAARKGQPLAVVLREAALRAARRQAP